MKVKCIIVDDEPMAREIISSFVAKIHNLELVATCKNVSEAFTVLQNESVQLIFLDINMPEIEENNDYIFTVYIVGFIFVYFYTIFMLFKLFILIIFIITKYLGLICFKTPSSSSLHVLSVLPRLIPP